MHCAVSRVVLLMAGSGLIGLGAGSAPAGAQPAPVAQASSAAGRTATVGPLPKPSGAGGYLPAGQIPDAASVIGPPPPPGSGTETGDVASFEATRAMRGTPRWDLATRDAVLGSSALMQDFSCALGVRLTQADAPALFRMLGRVVVDAGGTASHAKKVFKRPRPFIDHPGPLCVSLDPGLSHSWSYPSGHSTFSWTVGLILAEAAPDRAGDILARARVFGESRVVCGVHYESDVQAGRIAASVAFSALQAQSEFQSDLQAVRVELAALRKGGGVAPDAAECRIEDDAIAHPVW